MELSHGDVYTDYEDGPDGRRIRKPLSRLTGCIQLEARGSPHRAGDSEVREYHVRDGQLWAREIRRFAFGERVWDSIEFDGDQQLLFHSRREYDQATRKESETFRNRLEHEAYPEEVGPADSR